MRELGIVPTRYIFSEDLMTDATHRRPDRRGVDRTSLFEKPSRDQRTPLHRAHIPRPV